MEQDRTYTLRFNAWTASARNIFVTIDENGFDHMADGEQYTQYMSAAQSVTTVKTPYSYGFSMSGPTDFNAKLKFFVGGNGNAVYLDDVSLILNP